MRPPSVPTNAAAAVMATGIVGTSCAVAGLRAVGAAAFTLAVVLFVGVVVLLLLRSVLEPTWFTGTLTDPGAAFGWWTLVAALGVCGTLGGTLGIGSASVVALALGGPLWLLLTYGLLPWLFLHARARPLADHADGAWFLWVVGTESLAITLATLGAPAVALALWGVGLVLYLLLAAVVLVRMVASSGGPAIVAPTAWVVSGATAITTLAGARVLEHGPATAAPFISGASFVLWAWGTWCLPFLVGIGIRQVLILRQPVRYTTALWSIVFPLGMYSTASTVFGRVASVDILVTAGSIVRWVAVVAWVLVATVAVLAWASSVRRVRGRTPVGRDTDGG
jgi:tellurite resistance protein TehA-like permease